MGRNASLAGNGAEIEEHNILLVVIVIIGLLLMISLIMCYACVLRRLCCGSSQERRQRKAEVANKRTNSIPIGDVILLSQLTESEGV